MDLLYLNPYPNYSKTSFDPIVQMNQFGDLGKNKVTQLMNVKLLGPDPWKTEHRMAPLYYHDEEGSEFEMNINDVLSSNRYTIQDKSEKHLRDIALETDGQFLRNINSQDKWGGWDDLPPMKTNLEGVFTPKKFIYIGSDGHRKLSRTVLPKY